MTNADDPLAPARGICAGVALSLLAFWLPLLAIVITAKGCGQ